MGCGLWAVGCGLWVVGCCDREMWRLVVIVCSRVETGDVN